LNSAPAQGNQVKEFRLLSTSGILGYGFPEASLAAGMARRPDAIGVDGGSVDPGPHYLGSGKPFCSTMAIRRDLRLMLRGVEQHIPIEVGTMYRFSVFHPVAPNDPLEMFPIEHEGVSANGPNS
jgi:hypothetical protein